MRRRIASGHADALAYLVAQWAKTLPWVAFETYALLIWSRQLGIDTGSAGAWLFAAMFVHAFFDLILGTWIDRLPPRVVRTLAVGGLVLGMPLFLIALGVSARLPVWACVLALFLFRGGYAAFDVPHNAWITRLVDGAATGNWLASGRLAAIFLATGTLALIGQRFITAHGVAAPEFAILVATLWMLGSLPAALRLAPQPRRARVEPARTEHGWGWLSDERTMGLLGLNAASVVLLAFASAALVFVAGDRFGDVRWAGWAAGFLSVGKIAALPLWGFQADNRWRAMGAALLLCSLGAWLLAIAARVPVFLLGSFLLGTGAGGINVLCWSLLPEISERLSASHGEINARLVATFTAATKIAVGVGLLLLGVAGSAHAFALRYLDVSVPIFILALLYAAVGAAVLCAHRGYRSQPFTNEGQTADCRQRTGRME